MKELNPNLEFDSSEKRYCTFFEEDLNDFLLEKKNNEIAEDFYFGDEGVRSVGIFDVV